MNSCHVPSMLAFIWHFLLPFNIWKPIGFFGRNFSSWMLNELIDFKTRRPLRPQHPNCAGNPHCIRPKQQGIVGCDTASSNSMGSLFGQRNSMAKANMQSHEREKIKTETVQFYLLKMPPAHYCSCYLHWSHVFYSYDNLHIFTLLIPC